MTAQTIVREKGYGDFVLRLQYVNPNPHEIGSSHEPAIVIARPKRLQARSAWIIMLSSAWKYVSDGKTGNHSKYCQVASYEICKMLGLPQSKMVAFQIAEAINDTLEELINMPPYDPPRAEPMGTIEGNIGSHKVQVEVG